MKRVISWLQSIQLRHIITGFLVVLTFFISTAFDIYGNELQAQAEPVTPEATNYQVDSADSIASHRVKENVQDAAEDLARDTKRASRNAVENTQDAGNNLIETLKQNIESAADNVREKLNLDEPIDPGAKEVLDTIQGKDK